MACFGKDIEDFAEPLDISLFEKMKGFSLESRAESVLPGKDVLGFQKLELPASPIKQVDSESIVVLTHWLGAFIPSCFLPSSKLVALEMFQKIALQSSFELRL